MGRLAEATGNIPSTLDLLATPHVYSAQVSVEQLTALLDHIHDVTRNAQRLVSGRCDADLTGRMEPNSWSVAECFDHLAQTTRAFLPAISGAISTAPNLTTNRPLRTGMLARLFIRNLQPPYRIRFKVLAQLAPQQKDFEAAWNGFMGSQSELSEAVHSAAGLAIDRVRVESPVYARFSYNVFGAFRILAAHQSRHLWQSEEIFKALDRKAARNFA
jgi:hypothetical protein